MTTDERSGDSLERNRRLSHSSAGTRKSAWIGMLLALTAGVLFVGSPERDPLLLPVLTASVIAGLFYASLIDRDRPGAVLEVGTIYAAIVLLYTAFPIFAYLWRGGEFTIYNDIRLYRDQPGTTDLAPILWMYVAHLACFAVVYRLFRGRRRVATRKFRPDPARTWIAAVMLLGVLMFSAAMYRAYGLNAEGYAESYLLLQKMPLFAAQITDHVNGMHLTVEIVLMACLLRARKRRWWLIAAGWAVIAASTFSKLGSRTEFVLVSAAALVMFHDLVRPIRERILIIASIAVVGLFLVVGILRDEKAVKRESHDFHVLERTNEFEGILANAWDIQRLNDLHAIEKPPVAFVLTDLFSLVPQQLLPVTKISPADWYAKEFYSYAAVEGYGFAFGTIPESILFGGIVGAAIRGAGLGALFGLVRRWTLARPDSFWPYIVSVWAAALAYSSFRSTTFGMVNLFLYHVVPVVLAVSLLESLFRRVPVFRRSPAPA